MSSGPPMGRQFLTGPGLRRGLRSWQRGADAFGPHPDVEGFVLAGGRSSRMGSDKALVEFHGKPLVAWMVEILHAAGLDARIAGPPLEDGGKRKELAPVVTDNRPYGGPLAGVCSALGHAKSETVVFVPTDLPLVSPSLLRYLLWHAGVTGAPATVASLNGFAQTFPAVVRRDALATLQSELDAGCCGCLASFRAAGVTVVPVELAVQAGHVRDERGCPAYRWFWGINTPAELERARSAVERLD